MQRDGQLSLCFYSKQSDVRWQGQDKEMEELAKRLSGKIDNICGGFHYYKNENVLNRSQELANDIQQFCSCFLQGNIFGMEDEEYAGFEQYVIQVLEDYMEALKQKDMFYMLDTLDFGLRELLNIYIEAEEENHGERDI